MAELPSRKRRIMRRAVWTAAATVLLVAWYVVSWLIVSIVTTKGIISHHPTNWCRPVFIPVMYYCGSDLPGAKLLNDFWQYTNPPVEEVRMGWHVIYMVHPLAPQTTQAKSSRSTRLRTISD
jgi:hypothetical protein